MEKVEFLPIGSVVNMKGTTKKIMVIARALAATLNGETNYYDYGGVAYPEGLMGDQIMYFNHDGIVKIVHEGFHDEDNEMLVESLNEWVEQSTFERGNPLDVNKMNLQEKIREGQENSV